MSDREEVLDRPTRVYEYIVRFKQDNDGLSPTIRHMADHFETSTSVISYHLKKLAISGVIALADRRSGIKVDGGFWMPPEETMIVVVENPFANLLPQQATPYSAGYVLQTAEQTFFLPFQFKWVSVGMCFYLPEKIQMEIRPRSSFSLKQGWLVHHGTIGPDYFGPVMVGLMNIRPWFRIVGSGRRVAQAVFSRYAEVEFKEEQFRDLDSYAERSKYDHEGFGSSDG